MAKRMFSAGRFIQRLKERARKAKLKQQELLRFNKDIIDKSNKRIKENKVLLRESNSLAFAIKRRVDSNIKRLKKTKTSKQRKEIRERLNADKRIVKALESNVRKHGKDVNDWQSIKSKMTKARKDQLRELKETKSLERNLSKFKKVDEKTGFT